MDRITVVDTRKRRFVAQRNRFPFVTRRNDLILNFEIFLIGHAERHLCARRAVFIFNGPSGNGAFVRAKQLPACPVVLGHLDRIRHQRALGIHDIDKLKEVAATLKVNCRFVNQDGVLDTVAVRDLIAGLLQYVVLNGDGSTTGVKRLAPRLGTGRIFKRSRVRGSVEHSALYCRLIRQLGITSIFTECRRGDGEGDFIT